MIFNQKKRTCKILDSAVHVEQRVNLKEGEKRDKYLDLARESKKIWNMKVMVILIVVGAIGTISKRLVKGLEDLEIREHIETIQNIAPLRWARILRRILETWGDLPSFNLPWKTISFQMRIIIIIMIICNLWSFKLLFFIQIICTLLYCFKYSYPVLIICTLLFGFRYLFLFHMNNLQAILRFQVSILI